MRDCKGFPSTALRQASVEAHPFGFAQGRLRAQNTLGWDTHRSKVTTFKMTYFRVRNAYSKIS